MPKKDVESISQSPCVRNCCLNNDDLCLGCFRYIDEITSWQSCSEKEKQHILQQCQSRRDLSKKSNDKIN